MAGSVSESPPLTSAIAAPVLGMPSVVDKCSMRDTCHICIEFACVGLSGRALYAQCTPSVRTLTPRRALPGGYESPCG